MNQQRSATDNAPAQETASTDYLKQLEQTAKNAPASWKAVLKFLATLALGAAIGCGGFFVAVWAKTNDANVRIDAINDRVSLHETRISKVEDGVNDSKVSAPSYANVKDLETLRTTLATNSQVDAISKKLDALATKEFVDGLQRDSREQIKSLDGAISELPRKDYVDASISGIQKQLDALRLQVNRVEDKLLSAALVKDFTQAVVTVRREDGSIQLTFVDPVSGLADPRIVSTPPGGEQELLAQIANALQKTSPHFLSFSEVVDSGHEAPPAGVVLESSFLLGDIIEPPLTVIQNEVGDLKVIDKPHSDLEMGGWRSLNRLMTSEPSLFGIDK